MNSEFAKRHYSISKRKKAVKVKCKTCDGTGKRFLFLYNEDMTDKHCKQCNGYGWHMRMEGETDDT